MLQCNQELVFPSSDNLVNNLNTSVDYLPMKRLPMLVFRGQLNKCMAEFMNGKLKFGELSRTKRITCTKVKTQGGGKSRERGLVLYGTNRNSFCLNVYFMVF